MKIVEIVTAKEAYFLSLIGLIPVQFRQELLPLLQTTFSDEIKKFKVDDVHQSTVI